MTGKKAIGRTKQLSLKATPQFHQQLKILASKDKCLMIEILEEALKLYEQTRKERKKSAKQNIQTRVVLEPTTRSKRSRDEESPNTTKKRKIDQ